MSLTEIELGYLLGVLAGAAHFGGDGKQPQITLRMHTRHEALFRWLEDRVPEGKLYGPYSHSGRDYYQWMVRGAFLRETFVPLIVPHVLLWDDHVRARFQDMCTRYHIPTS